MRTEWRCTSNSGHIMTAPVSRCIKCGGYVKKVSVSSSSNKSFKDYLDEELNA